LPATIAVSQPHACEKQTFCYYDLIMSDILSPEEERRQLGVLSELRNRHHTTLVTSGIAQRVLDVGAPVNYLQNGDDFTEGTLLFPTRKKILEVAIGTLCGIRETISGSCTSAPQDIGEWFEYLDQYPDADLVKLGRIEAHRNNGWEIATIFVGIQQKRDSLENGFIPFDGVEVSDLIDLSKLLHEVKVAKESLNLSCLDPDSLMNTTIGRYAPTPLP
jgi:hypothetical protein